MALQELPDDSDRDAAIDRIVGEYADRRARGERVSPQEYLDRYPEYAQELEKDLAMIAMLSDDNGSREGAAAIQHAGGAPLGLEKGDWQRRSEDERFGQVLVAKGLVAPQVMTRALDKQMSMMAGGQFQRLCDLLVNENAITLEQAEAAFDAIGKSYRFCPKCRQRLNVRNLYRGKRVRCARCHHPFLVYPGSPGQAGSVETTVTLPGREASPPDARKSPISDNPLSNASPHPPAEGMTRQHESGDPKASA